MTFITNLSIVEVSGGKEFRLIAPLIYKGKYDTLTVPAGFVFDFASIPRFATWLVPKLGKYNKAACVHDYLYITQPESAKPLLPNASCRKLTRKDADGIFLRIMEEEGVELWRRYIMYFAVRLGGWVGWNRNKAKNMA